MITRIIAGEAFLIRYGEFHLVYIVNYTLMRWFGGRECVYVCAADAIRGFSSIPCLSNKRITILAVSPCKDVVSYPLGSMLYW